MTTVGPYYTVVINTTTVGTYYTADDNTTTKTSTFLNPNQQTLHELLLKTFCINFKRHLHIYLT